MYHGRMILLKPLLILFFAHGILFFSIMPGWGQDVYEDDDDHSTANIIVINDIAAQHHTLHDANDEDWVVFYALSEESYAIKTFNIETGVNTYIELYDTDGTTLLDEYDFLGDPNDDDTLNWTCGKTGIYYVKIRQAFSGTFTNEAGYDLVVYTTDLLSLPVYLHGVVKNSAGQPISYARLLASKNDRKGTGLSAANGSFILSLENGIYTILVSADGYQSKTMTGVGVPGSSLTVYLSSINAPPDAKEDYITVIRGGSVSGNVLLNDNDVNGDPLQAVLKSNVSHGSLTLSSDGSFVYRHNGDNSQSDIFTYYANDGFANSNTVPVTLRIENSKKACVAPVMLLLK